MRKENFRKALETALDTYYLGWETGNHRKFLAPCGTVRKWVSGERFPSKGNFNEFLQKHTFDGSGMVRENLLTLYVDALKEDDRIYIGAASNKHAYIPLYRLSPDYEQVDLANIIGASSLINGISQQLLTDNSNRFLSIEGQGGIGKTTIAYAVVNQIRQYKRFKAVLWLAKGQYLSLQNLKVESIATNSILSQLQQLLNLKDAQLVLEVLQNDAYLVVIDNLETPGDAKEALEYLQSLQQGNSCFLLTSRYALSAYMFVVSYPLSPLSLKDGIRLLQEQMAKYNRSLSQSKAEEIIRLVGGIPLAIHLIVRLAKTENLHEILGNIKLLQADASSPAEKIEIMFDYIYGTIWMQLDEQVRAFLVRLALQMPVEGVSRDAAVLIAGLEKDSFSQILSQAIDYYMLRTRGEDDEQTFFMHPLSIAFINNRKTKAG